MAEIMSMHRSTKQSGHGAAIFTALTIPRRILEKHQMTSRIPTPPIC